MDTKRCSYCHKLARAEAETCSRCGHPYVKSTNGVKKVNRVPMKSSNPASRGNRRNETVQLSMSDGNTPIQRPSIPPASPHRAGHYSGLHPEDQPYQSSVMAVQHAPVRKSEQWRRAEQEEDSVILPAVETDPSIPLAPRRSFSKKPGPQKSVVPIILTISCLLLLVVGSLFVYTLIAAKPQHSMANHDLTATPNSLRVTDTFTLSGRGFGANDLIKFTHDPNDNVLDGNGKPLQVPADDIGTFSVRIVVPADWEPGQHRLYAIDEGQQFSDSVVITILQASSAPPHLQLSDISVDLGANAPGAVSNRNITLTNAGGGQLS